MLADMPPSTASEVFSFFDNMESLLGCTIVTQPSEISALGMTRTIDFLRHRGNSCHGARDYDGRVFASRLRPSDTPVALPQARYEEGSQGLRGAFLDIHSANSGCGAIGGVTRLSCCHQPSEISALGMRHIVDILRLLGGSHDAICARIAERQATSFFPPSSPWTPLLGCVIRLQSPQRGP